MHKLKVFFSSTNFLLISTYTYSSEIGNKMKVSGEFQVKLQPMDFYAKGAEGINFGRMSIDKTFWGALEATSKGEMLSAMTPTKGSAGYVAIEQVIGSLSGKKGSMPFCVELDNLKDTDAPIHQPAAMLVAAD